MEREMRWVFIRQCQFCLRDERGLKFLPVPDVVGSVRVVSRAMGSTQGHSWECCSSAGQGQCWGFPCLQKCGNALCLHLQQVLKAYSKVWIDLLCKSDYNQSAISLRRYSCFCDEEAGEIIPSVAGLLLEEQLKMVIFKSPFQKTSEKADLFFLFSAVVLLYQRDYLEQHRFTLNRSAPILQQSLGIQKLTDSENCRENTGFWVLLVNWSSARTGCSTL